MLLRPTRSSAWPCVLRPTMTLSGTNAVRRHADNRTANRRRGRARRGKRARGVVFFNRGTRYSSFGVFSLLGMIGVHVIEGNYDADQFLIAVRRELIPNLRPYPQDHSVVVCDNCPGLHHQLEFVRMVKDVGARVVFLEPYDPEHNPIELAFRTAKWTLRGPQREALAHYPRRERLRRALLRVGARAARSHFRECGYDL